MKEHSRFIVLIDSGDSGVSGDKYLGALLGLGASIGTLKKVARTVENILPGVKKIDVSFRAIERGEIGAQLVQVETQENMPERKAGIVRDAIEDASKKLKLSQWGRSFGLETIRTLMNAESNVHGHAPKDTILHELGSADTIVDILGTAALIEELKLTSAIWLSTPLAVGSGIVKFSGRSYPNPAPAVLEILKSHKFPIRGGSNEKTELTTPTGAAITVNLAERSVETYPGMVPVSAGYGAGSKELAETANLLRLTVGKVTSASHAHDHMVILETNLDDVTGEVIGYTIEKLFEEGARDVTVTPIYMKKNRPGHLLSVITDEAKAEKLANVIIEETGTLGVREIPVNRHIALRQTVTSKVSHGGRGFKVRVKEARDAQGGLVHEKPESDDLKRVARRTGLSFREASRLAMSEREATE